MSTHKIAAWLLVPPLAAYALLAWKLDFLCDDAFISFRYSKHLAEGHGLRYNLDGSPPVEGYSNFLWVAWLGLLHRLGADIALSSRLTSALSGALLVLWVTRFAARRLALGSAGTLATGLFLATLPPVAVWATSGLETMLVALLVFGCYERLLGDAQRPRGMAAGTLAALAGLARADGAVWVLLLLGSAALVWLWSGRRRELGRAALVTFGIFALAVAAHVAWRVSYYGDFLPNTARLKAGFSDFRIARGFDYVAAWLLTLPSAAIVLASGLWRWRAEERTVALPALCVTAGTLAYAIWVGGDFMPMGRFLFPAVPFVALLFALAWSRLAVAPAQSSWRAPSFAALCICLSLLACFDRGPVPAALRARFHFRADRPWESEIAMWRGMRERAARWALEGRALAHCTLAGESMILGAIGARGFYSELTLFDTYGLISAGVHERGQRVAVGSPGHDVRVEPEFFLAERPTYLGAVLARVGATELEGLPAGWLDMPYHAMVTLERCPLPAEAGFPAGVELRLLRFHRWD